MRLSEFKKLMMTLMFVWLNINVLMLYNICSSSSQDNSDWLAVNVLMDSKEERNLNPSSRDAVVGTKDTRSSDQAVSTKPVEPANKNKNMKGGDEKVAVLVLVDSKEERIRNPRSRDDDVGTKVTRSSDQAASTKPVEPTNKNKNKNKNDNPANDRRWSAIECRRTSYSNNNRSANSTFNYSPPNAVKSSTSRTLRKVVLREDFNLKTTKRVDPNFSPKSKIIEMAHLESTILPISRWSATGTKVDSNSKRDLPLSTMQHS